MYSGVLSMGSSHLDISSVLERAENICRKSHAFRSEWPKELCCAQEKISQNVTHEIQKAIQTLLYWEMSFKQEIPEIPLNVIKERLTEMCSLENVLLKGIARIRRLTSTSESENVLLQEAHELLKIIAIIEEKMRCSVFPVVTFHEVAPFSKENRHKFWTFATLDIQPHQLILQYSGDIKPGRAVFCVYVPPTKCLAQLTKLLKCTLELEGTKVLQILKPYCNNGHIDIEVNITNRCHNTINVQLYEHHICGSPFKFLPFQKLDPMAIEQYRAGGQCCSSLKAQKTLIALDKDNSFSSSSDDDDPMMDSQEYQFRRQRLSKAGIARVNSFLGEAALDRANETTILEDLKGREDARSVEMGPNQSLVLEEKVLESETLNFNIDEKYQEPDMYVIKEADKKFSVSEKTFMETNNISIQNIEVISQDCAQHDVKRWKSPLFEKIVDDMRKSIANGNEVAADGNLADNVEHGAYQNNPPQNLELCQNTVKIEQTATEPLMSDGELLRRMTLDDSLNQAGDEPENHGIFIPKVASRKKLGLIQPLRRPRVPSLLSEVASVSHHKYEDLKNREYVNEEEKTPLLKLEVQNTTQQCNSNDTPGTRVDFKTLPEVPLKIAQTTESNENQPEPFKALKSTNVSTKREDDVKAAGLSDSDSFANSGEKKIALDDSPSYKENTLRQMAEGKPATSLGTKSGKYQNISAKLSGKISKKLCGPSDDPLFQPIGVAELNDKRVVVADTFNNRMGLFSSEGVFLKYLNSVHLRRPSAVVVLQNGNFAVKENHGIVIFEENGDFLKTLPAPLKRPYGLTVLEDGNLMTVETTGKGCMTLVTINPDSGLDVSRVEVDLGLPPKYHQISKPRFISYHRHGRILVVDLGLNCVFVVDISHGTVLSVFGEEGSYEGQFRDPSGIACDIDGYIVVGDSRNHRIQVFDPYGHFLCILATDVPLNRPSGIFLSSSGELLVSNYWDQSVAKYLLTN